MEEVEDRKKIQRAKNYGDEKTRSVMKRHNLVGLTTVEVLPIKKEL